MPDFDAVLKGYVECALWSSSIEEDGLAILRQRNDPDYPSEILDRAAGDWGFDRLDMSITDLDSTARASINETVRSFLATAPADALSFWSLNHGDEAIGHDLWLTQNRHGAGFWDRWSADTAGYDYGKALTDHAHPYGERHIYVGDDARLYIA